MTTIHNPADPRIQAILLRGHLKLRRAGLKGKISQTMLLAKASAITNLAYPNTAAGRDKAITDLTTFIEESLA